MEYKIVVALRTFYFIVLASTCGLLHGVVLAEELVYKSRQDLPRYEANVYGPMPFSEEVTEFLEHELNYILSRQNANGSWDSAEPIGGGRTRTEAGGTVGNVTLTSMCGYSLRHFCEYEPKRYKDSIQRAVEFVSSMICSGKLRNNVIDAPWHYIYSLRFLAREYPQIEDNRLKKQVDDACQLIIQQLKETQHGTYGQRSIPFRWEKRSSPGVIVVSTDSALATVVHCDSEGPAFAAGIREGDQLISANDTLVDSAVRYALAEMTWMGGDTVDFILRRGERVLKIPVTLPYQYPGTLGLKTRDAEGTVVITGFDLLSNRDSATVQIGDELVAIGDHRIAFTKDLEALSFHAGQETRLRIRRDGKIIELDYICAPMPSADFGITFPNGRFDQSTKRGIPIDRFYVRSCLRAAGLQTGDRLIRIDDSLVLHRQHFRQLARSLWGGKQVIVTYSRDGQEKKVKVRVGSLSNERWLTGYHGLKLRVGALIESVSYGSPADKAGCLPGDQVVQINESKVTSDRQAMSLLNGLAAGRKTTIEVQRGEARKRLTYVANRAAESVWIAERNKAGGGWGYLTGVRGSNTFTTADALRELLTAKRFMPHLDVPDEMLRRAFLMLSNLRSTQPNSQVESYRYDAAGSFWRVKDIRGDIGRINSAELACVMYCDSFLPAEGHKRTQENLERTLKEWLQHRGILDLVKFPSGHADYSIAPWFWMYSYRTTLEAADYLTSNDELKQEVQATALKALFRHMEFRHETKLGSVGWIIGGDRDKELHDSCQLLDGLATLKHLFRSRLVLHEPSLQEALNEFRLTRYGAAHQLLLAASTSANSKEQTAFVKESAMLRETIRQRFDLRLSEIQKIQGRSATDGMYYTRMMQWNFAGYPEYEQISKEVDFDLIDIIDLNHDPISGDWKKDDAKLISPVQPYARIQLLEAPLKNYRFEVQFTRAQGDCVAVMFPVAKTSTILVISGWGGKVSGLAFVDGNDANRNSTTRDGTLANGKRHTVEIAIREVTDDLASIDVNLNGEDYLSWEGKTDSLVPDRQWNLRRRQAIGLGAYNAAVNFHSCRLETLDSK